MYDIRQFKPALYSLLILGMTGFALAAESPGLWVISVGAILLNAWLVKTGRFRPLPRFIANLVTILALIYVVLVVRHAVATPILIVGQFLVLLQIVKLFEQRANRDFAQLLVLSLLLIVAASISTASLLFGLLLIAYLFLALYVCLLFHLKVETDHAKHALDIPEERLNPATLRQDQRYLSRSMRRLTGFVALVAVLMAVFVFLMFPRGNTGALLGPLQFRPSQALTGFNDQLQFQTVARITQNPQVVAYVSVWKDEQPVDGTMPLLLRGKTLQVYLGDDPASGAAWQWARTAADRPPEDSRPGTTIHFQRHAVRMITETTLLGHGIGEARSVLHEPSIPSQRWRQRITLDPTGTPVLFAIAGVVQFTPSAPFDDRVQYSAEDHSIQTTERLISRVSYEAVSTNVMPDAGPSPPRRQRERRAPGDRLRSPIPERSNIEPRIEQFARRPEVSGADDAGPLNARRDPNARVTPLDVTIASNIEQYLRSNFLYTLDLTDAYRAAGTDPMVGFLYDFKRGHCEYFAGAMTLMCQSLGMQARVVIGFKSDEYNNIGAYYIVRQSHAHSWVEVLGDDGFWHTFDPTGARTAAATHAGLWQRLRHLFNFMEFTWASTVVAYDRESRTNILRTTENSLVNTAISSTEQINRARRWIADADPYLFSSKLISALINVLIAGVIAAVLWYLFEKWKLRRRARRIGLDALPPSDQLRLARQLGFYDDLLRLLERYRIFRPRHLTPMEFSQSISFLPTESFMIVRRLTEIFYRVRFGGAELSSRQRNRLHHAIDRLERVLASHSTRDSSTGMRP